MNFTPADWSVLFDSTKQKIQSKRKNGEVFSSQEAHQLLKTIDGLEVQLRAMTQSPLQYEM